MASTGQGKVERIAFEIGRLAAEQEVVDGRCNRPERGGVCDAQLSNDFGHAIASLSLTASYYRPVSIVGTMFQLLVAAHEFENVVSNLAPEVARKHVVEEMTSQIRRQLRGSIDYLEGHCGTPLSAIGGGFYILNDQAGALLDVSSAAGRPAGASLPTPIAPTVVSARWDDDVARPRQPIFASAEDQLIAMSARYEELEDLVAQLTDIECEAGAALSGRTDGSASDHALRMRREILALINGVRATTSRELGLKARVAFDLQGTDWRGDGEKLSVAEEALRSLVLDVMAAAGVTVIPTPDVPEGKLRERAKNGRWEFEPAPAEAAVAEMGEAA